MAKPLPYQEEIEYTRALDDQVKEAKTIHYIFHHHLFLFFRYSYPHSWIGWQLFLAAKLVAVPECDVLPPDGEVWEEQAVVLLCPNGGE